LVEVKNLIKRYGTHLAVDDISFTIDKGEIVGFLGPNGAGKTTTMNILTGYISATAGEVSINSNNVLDDPMKAKADIGYLPDSPPLYNNMLVDEYLNFVCEIKKVARNGRSKMIAEIKEMVRISDMGKRMVGNLSKGYRQRVGLAQALVGYPKVLIFDEPTNGFDPKQIIEMRQVIKDLGESHTLIISSHILSEVQAMCDRILIINRGKIVAPDTALTQNTVMTVRIKGIKEDIIKAFGETPLFKTVTPLTSRESGTFDIEISGGAGEDVREAIFFCAAKNNMPILSMKAEVSLEEIFLAATSAGGAANAGDS